MKFPIIILIIVIVGIGFLFWRNANQFPIPEGENTEVISDEQIEKEEEVIGKGSAHIKVCCCSLELLILRPCNQKNIIFIVSVAPSTFAGTIWIQIPRYTMQDYWIIRLCRQMYMWWCKTTD